LFVAVSAPRYRPDTGRSIHLTNLLLLGLGLVALRVVYVQVIRQDYFLNEIAPLIATRGDVSLPQPGSLLGRNGEALAESVLLTSVLADPARMLKNGESFDGAAEQLAGPLGRPREQILADLKRNPASHYVELARWSDQQTAQAVRKLGIKGVSLRSEWKRQYPGGRLACHTLGGRDRRHVALAGLEYQFRVLLDGQPGANPALPACTVGGTQGLVPPLPGKDLVLTLEPDLQRQVEAEMDTIWVREKPRWVSCVVMDPRTGAILALAGRPDYDPNDYVTGKPAPGYKWSAVPATATHNIPVDQSVEQGSTFKILLAAAALDKGAVKPEARFHCGGSLGLGGKPIGCWGEWGAKGHGSLDMAGMLANSCNICAAQIGLRLGKEAYHEFLKNAGISTYPEAGFMGEAKGRLQSLKTIKQRDLATMAFGQNVSCSNLQLTAIISGLVNGGVKMRPHIVAAALNKDGSVYREIPPQVEARLCSEQTSVTLKKMLEGVVENGTGRAARLPDFRVGGKTGTAQQWDPTTGRHYSDRHMVSFVLVAPADQPRYVIQVACNEPKVGRHGSDVAAPAARRIAEYALRQLDAGLGTGKKPAQP
jgi:stage V sporulation protein D (sporulation-specific penicillin-binding protein)